MAKKKNIRTTKRTPAEPSTDPRPGIVADALDSLDYALLACIAGTVGREGSGLDAHNLAVAVKAAQDIRSVLLTGVQS